MKEETRHLDFSIETFVTKFKKKVWDRDDRKFNSEIIEALSQESTWRWFRIFQSKKRKSRKINAIKKYIYCSLLAFNVLIKWVCQKRNVGSSNELKNVLIGDIQ